MQGFKSNVVVLFFLGIIVTGCSSSRRLKAEKSLIALFETEDFDAHHSGFFAIDLGSNDTLIAHNASTYFVPASTTKLFTTYAVNKTLGQFLPAMKYNRVNDTIVVLGTGDPTWLHPHFKNNTPIRFIEQFDVVKLYLDNYKGKKFAPGWAWEDYEYDFSTELGPLPLYGNVVEIQTSQISRTKPSYFLDKVSIERSRPNRDWKENRFYIDNTISDTLYIPFMTSKSLTQRLLGGVLSKPTLLLDSLPKKKWSVLPGIPTDSILKHMLLESDNFLAEQLMLTVSSTYSDILDFNAARDTVLSKYLNFIEQQPRWVDGSGLSRYNLFTPKSMVAVIKALHLEMDSLRLFTLLPRWNKDGTIKEAPARNEDFTIYAKSGSMGNIYNLCGLMRTSSGRLIAFSFMNNNFRIPSSSIRRNIYKGLKKIYLYH